MAATIGLSARNFKCTDEAFTARPHPRGTSEWHSRARRRRVRLVAQRSVWTCWRSWRESSYITQRRHLIRLLSVHNARARGHSLTSTQPLFGGDVKPSIGRKDLRKPSFQGPTQISGPATRIRHPGSLSAALPLCHPLLPTASSKPPGFKPKVLRHTCEQRQQPLPSFELMSRKR